MNPNYIRPGGVAVDLHEGWRDDVLALCETVEAGVRDYDELLSQNPIWLERTVGVGRDHHRRVPARSRSPGRSCAPPGSRGTCARRSRTSRTTRSTSTSSTPRTATSSTGYRIRLYEILESVKIVRQCVEKMPPGDYRVQDKKVTPPPRARIDESMEALIHHFKLFTEGFKVPAGEIVHVGRVAAR